MKKLGVVNSVLVGKTVTFAHGANSAIDKQVLSERQHATELGFTNDEQGDPRFHGGIQKALHIYPSEHYPVWQQELGDKDIFQSAGAFGENLSSSGITEQSICLKDKVRIDQLYWKSHRGACLVGSSMYDSIKTIWQEDCKTHFELAGTSESWKKAILAQVTRLPCVKDLTQIGRSLVSWARYLRAALIEKN